MAPTAARSVVMWSREWVVAYQTAECTESMSPHRRHARGAKNEMVAFCTVSTAAIKSSTRTEAGFAGRPAYAAPRPKLDRLACQPHIVNHPEEQGETAEATRDDAQQLEDPQDNRRTLVRQPSPTETEQIEELKSKSEHLVAPPPHVAHPAL